MLFALSRRGLVTASQWCCHLRASHSVLVFLTVPLCLFLFFIFFEWAICVFADPDWYRHQKYPKSKEVVNCTDREKATVLRMGNWKTWQRNTEHWLEVKTLEHCLGRHVPPPICSAVTQLGAYCFTSPGLSAFFYKIRIIIFLRIKWVNTYKVFRKVPSLVYMLYMCFLSSSSSSSSWKPTWKVLL